jgi:predicted Zn-dependent peptidase
MTSDFESITVDDINALAKEYLAKGKATQVLIVTE